MHAGTADNPYAAPSHHAPNAPLFAYATTVPGRIRKICRCYSPGHVHFGTRPAPVIGAILPPPVLAEFRCADAPEATLFPAEEAVVAGAVAQRRGEFATVRLCARQALARLGEPAVPLVPGQRGAPCWPPGVVGSLTHCQGYRAAAVARAAQVLALGIDAEPHGPLPRGVRQAVALPEEAAHLDELAAGYPDTHWDRLLFSAKESVYKAWYPLTGRWLGFADARLVIDPDAGEFSATFRVPGARCGSRELTGFTGRWLVTDALVLTCVVVPG
jgi:4'-phosphopantetheinyl transferase EntD